MTQAVATTTTPAELRRLLHRFGMERDRLCGALAQAAGLTPTDLGARREAGSTYSSALETIASTVPRHPAGESTR